MNWKDKALLHAKQEDPKDFTIMDPVYMEDENDDLPF